jgi:SulP family sulfate permease
MKKGLFRTIKENIVPGVTLGLVSLPLALSLAIASHTTPLIGMITSVWAGLIAALCGGSHYNIVGPTAALTGFLASNSISSLPMLAIMASAFIFLAYLLKLERYLVFVPASAIHGFLLGVASIIILNQLGTALGLQGLAKRSSVLGNAFQSLMHAHQANFIILGIFISVIAILVIFQNYVKRIPGIIIVTPLSLLLGWLSTRGIIPLSLETLGSEFLDMPSQIMAFPSFVFDRGLITPALTVALIAILETMISAKVADGMTKTKHHKGAEVRGLAFANFISGIFGGMPAGAAPARTALNVKAGATNRMSAVISSLCVAIIALSSMRLFAFLPLIVVAAILVFAAFHLVQFNNFLRMYRGDRKNFYLSLVVAFTTICEGPIVGIFLGIATAMLLLMQQLSRGHYELSVGCNDHADPLDKGCEKIDQCRKKDGVLIYSIKGQLVYINAQAHIARFERDLSHYSTIILNVKKLYFIDMDGVDALAEIITLVQSKNKKVLIVGDNTFILTMLAESGPFKSVRRAGLVFKDQPEALAYLGLAMTHEKDI